MAQLNARRSTSMPDTATPQVELIDAGRVEVAEKKLSGRYSGLSGVLSRLTTRAWERDDDIARRHAGTAQGNQWLTFWALTFQSIGIVYGDIGTSFIYVFPSVYTETPSKEDIIGGVSLVVWTITALVMFKYALTVLRMDDNGQGGAFALYSVLKRQAELGSGSQSLNRSLSQYSVGPSHKNSLASRLSTGKGSKAREHRRQLFIENPLTQNILRVLVVFGVGAIMGDGVLTPSVSVVSACEGILVRWPSVSRGTIDGIAIAIIVVLFGIQQFGTGFVGTLFSPIVTVWLLANAVIGVYNIARYYPGIFVALGPNQWFSYFLRNGNTGWRSLGGVLLCVTGCEALFADLGHFNRRSIQTSFIFLCWPCLLLTYLGQAAYLVKNPDKFGTSFWDSLPHGTFYPMFILATMAAIIASQALISAAFQIVKQAIAQGFFPRFTVIHTSKKHHGQIYIPFICYLLGGLCVILIATFKTSLQLTKAYGLAVVIDMLLTTHFATLVIFCVWQLPFYFPLTFYLVFGLIEATFLSATVLKIPTGGWFSLMMSAIYTMIMLLWFWGSHQKTNYFNKNASNLAKLLQTKEDDSGAEGKGQVPHPSVLVLGETPVARVRGVAVYYSDVLYGSPPALERHITRFAVLHDLNVMLTNRVVPVPEVMDQERFLVKQLPIPGFYHVIARYGYGERILQGVDFVDAMLQRIALLLYTGIQSELLKSPELRNVIPLPRFVGEAERIEDTKIEVMPIIEDSEFIPEDRSLPARLPSRAVEQQADFTAVNIPAEGKGGLFRRSAPAGSAATAYPATRPHSSAHGFTDTSFQPVIVPGSEGPNQINSTTAAAISDWARSVAAGQVTLDKGQDSLQQLVREVSILATAKEEGFICVVGLAQPRSNEKTRMVKKYFMHTPYLFLVHNFLSQADIDFGIPQDNLALVGMPYDL